MNSPVPSSFPYKAYYFCVFAGPAIVTGYLNLFYRRSGLTDGQIGSLSAVLAIVGVVAPLLWGAASDALGSRRRPGILLMVLSGLVFPLFWWVHRMPGAMLLAALFGFVMSPIIPLVDAETMAYARRWEADYGRIRVWGSIGFATAMASLGLVLPPKSGLSAHSLAPVFIAFVLWRIAGVPCAALIPEEPAPRSRTTGTRLLWQSLREVAGLFARRRMLLFLCCTSLGWAAMQSYYAFFTIYLDTLKVSDQLKGLFWDIGVVAEILFMFRAGALQKRIGPHGLLTLGLAAQAARLLLFSYRSPLWVIAIGQGLHAFTFGAFYVGCIAILSEVIPDRLRAGGQTFFSGVAMGLGGAMGARVAGAFAQAHGIPAMFRCASIAAGIAVLLSLMLHFRAADSQELRS